MLVCLFVFFFLSFFSLPVFFSFIVSCLFVCFLFRFNLFSLVSFSVLFRYLFRSCSHFCVRPVTLGPSALPFLSLPFTFPSPLLPFLPFSLPPRPPSLVPSLPTGFALFTSHNPSVLFFLVFCLVFFPFVCFFLSLIFFLPLFKQQIHFL